MFKNLRSLSIKDHICGSHEDEEKLLRIIRIPSLIYLYVDEPVEAKLR